MTYLIKSMKICLVGPGIMQIPPVGWGAVEILIWDYYTHCKKNNHDVVIVNKLRKNHTDQSSPYTLYSKELIAEINDGGFDVVHLHYDCLYHILPFLTCPKIAITSHYPYMNQPQRHSFDGFGNIYSFLRKNKSYLHFMIAQKDIDFMISEGADPGYIFLLENGVDSEYIRCTDLPRFPHKTIYLGNITTRKKQHIFDSLETIDIIGPNPDQTYLKNWKGEWTRDDVSQKLTEYGNLLLISAGEADPLVVKEALMAGLGVVINESSSKNLQASDFITIIEDNRMDDFSYVKEMVSKNLQTLRLVPRSEIRRFAEESFSWRPLIEKYTRTLENF